MPDSGSDHDGFRRSKQNIHMNQRMLRPCSALSVVLAWFARTGSARIACMSQAGAIDRLSKRIIEQLQEDGRRSYAEIGRAVGLSEAAVRQRVQRLTDSGAMQVVAVTDPMQLGFHRQAMIGIRVGGDSRAVAAELEKIPAVDYLVLTAGS